MNGTIGDNHFVDNTDVDLIVGGTGSCTVARNEINHDHEYGFAGLMLGWFGESNGYPTGPRTARVTAIANGTATITASVPRGPASAVAQGTTVTTCVDPLSTSSITWDYQARSAATVTVTAPAGCGWTAFSLEAWIAVTGGASGSGSRTVTYAFPENAGGARTGRLILGGRVYTIVQPAQPCHLDLWPGSGTLPSASGAGAFDVSTTGSCAWTATVSEPAAWLHTASSGVGNGTVTFTVDPYDNTSYSRAAVIHVGDATYTVTQTMDPPPGGGGGPSCVDAVTAPQVLFGAGGGAGTATVTAADGCAWTVSSQASWLTVVGPASGTGNGVVTFTVAANGGASSRLGRLVVDTRVLTITEQSTATSSCPPFSGNDTDDDTAGIQCLLDQLDPGGTVTLDADVLYGYYIGGSTNPGYQGQGLHLTHSNTILTSTSAYGYRALLIASPQLRYPILEVESGSLSGYRIEKIWFFGNRFNRTCDQTLKAQHRTVNVWLKGSFTVDDIESDSAVCGTSTVVDNTTHHFTISNSWFADNGWARGTAGHANEEWSDGLTVHTCVDGEISNNHFVDNTDVDLIFGGTGHCTVTGNVINHDSTYGFAGLMLGWFDENNAYPDYSQFTFTANHVTSQADELSVGLMIGFHPWGAPKINGQFQFPWISDVGQVGSATASNTLTGAVINLAIDGIQGGVVSGNELGQSQGNPNQNHSGLNDCPTVANYTAGHFGSAQIQNPSLAVPLVWDRNGALVSCQSPQH